MSDNDSESGASNDRDKAHILLKFILYAPNFYDLL